ncbi:trans-sialidase, putative [Trypanosoma cruzi marinkellei]|uniref:Trans-sialidase, putative n=1 Tax=Trypanosoma cruzi marinkellei TaxID=85056 RepID=K2MYP1_TRYCR|nr:trans-sialidase, putative [Trypanosoma cruzi marinkellei]
MGGRVCCFNIFLSISISLTHALERRKTNAIIATVKFEGSERTNSTHAPATHTYICMHSRVAAVKVPRTHNRRRVTGSSGRRREGGESERQRPNMSRHHFYSAVLLLLVVTMCCSIGASAGEVSAPVSSKSKPFVWRDKKNEETVSSLRVPSLVEMNGKVFAVAEAQCKNSSDKLFTGIASKLLALTDRASEEELVATQVKTQILVECPSNVDECASKDAHVEGSQSEKKVDVSRPTAVVEGGKIYMLVGNYSQTAVAQESGAEDSGILLVKGDVSQESGTENKIEWENTNDVSRASLGAELKSWTWLTGGGGLGVDMGDGKLLFPVEGTKKIKKDAEPEKNEKAVSLIIYTLSDSASWTLSKGMSADGCSDPSVVEWEKDKLMMMTACDDGRRRVYEIRDGGESWTEALGTLSRVWVNPTENEKSFRSGFTTATFGEENDQKNVMLITLPVYAKKDNPKDKLHLWLTDNTHIVDIGPVSGEDKEEIAASSLLYKSDDNNKDELIALYENKKDGEETSLSMFSVRLTAELQRVKDVLNTWKEVDKRVSQLCLSESDEKDRPTVTPCSSTFNITDGLVGFLSGKFSETTWRDEYLGVNATINKGTEEATAAVTAATGPPDGVTFRGAWAEWPVGAQGENQLYHFANYNFTLVATVSIDGVPEGSIPLMGVKMNGDENKVLLGLSYNKKKISGRYCAM